MIAIRLAPRDRLSYITGADVRHSGPQLRAALSAIPRLWGTALTGREVAVPVSVTAILNVE
jgi:hypothetical protein